MAMSGRARPPEQVATVSATGEPSDRNEGLWEPEGLFRATGGGVGWKQSSSWFPPSPAGEPPRIGHTLPPAQVYCLSRSANILAGVQGPGASVGGPGSEPLPCCF